MRGLACVMLLFLVACAPAAVTLTKPLIVTSSYPLWYFASEIAGDSATVVNLVPPGVEPHEWDPQPSDIREVAHAVVFVYNGAGFEPNIDRLLTNIGNSTIVVDSSTKVEVQGDPHIWLDPRDAAKQAQAIGDAMQKALPADAQLYAQRTEDLVGRLQAVDTAYSAGLAVCKRKGFITTHEAFGHLASAYGLTQYSISGLTPDAEPSPKTISGLVDLAKADGIKYVMVEPLANTKIATTLADEIGGSVMMLDPLEVMTKERLAQGETYFTVMGQNLNNLKKALECS